MSFKAYSYGVADKKAAWAVISRPLTQETVRQSRGLSEIVSRFIQRRDSLSWEPASFLFGVNRMPTSALQHRTKQRMLVLLSNYEIQENLRPDWLINPETGHALEIDLYLPELKIGIEVQGIQHQKFTPHFHLTPADFDKQRARDDYKKAICAKRGVMLYEVFSPADIENFIERVRDHHPDMAKVLYLKFTAILSLSYLAAQLHIENKQRTRNADRMQSLTTRILHVCTKYNIPPQSVKPNFELSKMQMAFAGKLIVHVIYHGFEGRTLDEHGAVIKVEDGMVFVSLPEKGKSTNNEIKLDILTGKQENAAETYWQLSDNSLAKVQTKTWGSVD